MKPSEVIVDNLRGDGHKVETIAPYTWIVQLKNKHPIIVKGVKELNEVWCNNQP